MRILHRVAAAGGQQERKTKLREARKNERAHACIHFCIAGVQLIVVEGVWLMDAYFCIAQLLREGCGWYEA